MPDPVRVLDPPVSSRRWKALAICSTAFLIALLLGLLATKALGTRGGIRRLDAPAVLVQVKQLNQLVTVRYSVQRVVGLTEPKVPFGSESILLLVEGRVLAGVDLSKLDPGDITISKNGDVQINLPSARLMEAFLDEKQTRVWDRQITWWTPWVPFNPDLEHKARLQALEDVRSAALKMGILDQAQQNAESALRALFGTLHHRVQFGKLGA